MLWRRCPQGWQERRIFLRRLWFRCLDCRWMWYCRRPWREPSRISQCSWLPPKKGWENKSNQLITKDVSWTIWQDHTAVEFSFTMYVMKVSWRKTLILYLILEIDFSNNEVVWWVEGFILFRQQHLRRDRLFLSNWPPAIDYSREWAKPWILHEEYLMI